MVNCTECRNAKKLKRQLYTDQDYRNAIRWNYRRDWVGTTTWLKISIYPEAHTECK